MGRKRLNSYQRKKKQEESTFVPADPRCQECFYWGYFGGIQDEAIYCCHYALCEGKLRERISETECGSFVDGKTAQKRKYKLQSVPMTQWGCGGLGFVRKGER